MRGEKLRNCGLTVWPAAGALGQAHWVRHSATGYVMSRVSVPR
jgi:hypothetical protein